MFTTLVGIVALVLPALVFLGLTLIGSAPGEWGRGALTAWLVLASVVIAGLSFGPLGGWMVLAVLAGGMIAIVTGGGGTTGLVLSVVIVAALTVGQYIAGPYPIHAAILPVLAAIGLVAALHTLFV